MGKEFKEWKGKLGWRFSADDCAYAYKMCKEANEWFEKTYGIKPQATHRYLDPDRFKLYNTKEAQAYLKTGYKTIRDSIENGLLTLYYKPGYSRAYLRKDELDKLRRQLQRKKKHRH